MHRWLYNKAPYVDHMTLKCCLLMFLVLNKINKTYCMWCTCYNLTKIIPFSY